MVAIHPTPAKCEPLGTMAYPDRGISISVSAKYRTATDNTIVKAFRTARFSVHWSEDDGAGYPVRIGEAQPGSGSLPDISGLGDEAYTISADPTGVTVAANSGRAVLYGLSSLTQLISPAGIECGTIIDYPSFAHRGVVEGFFGRPYSDKDRLDLVEYIGRLKMNVYLYGPKDDPYHRVRWREKYDRRRMAAFSELVDRAESVGVEFGWAAGPGFTVRYSDERDVAAMADKFGQMASIGVRLFAIFYDDIFEQMQYPQDRSEFNGLAQAQAAFTRRVWRRVKESWPDARMLVCPTEYRGDADSDYVVELGAGVPVEIPLIWTGPNVCSRSITVEHTRAVAERMGRPPAYWDNYPVNDASMVFDLHVGPLRGRDATLGETCWGMLFNPMNLAESSKIPLFTAADYTWNSTVYEPETSWRAALDHVDRNCAADWERVFDYTRGSCLDDSGSVRLADLLAEYNERIQAGGRPDVEPMATYFADLASALDRVAAAGVNMRLAREVGPWISRLRVLHAVAAEIVSVFSMATGDKPLDIDRVRHMRGTVMREIDSLRDAFLPHVAKQSVESLALRAVRVSEELIRGDMDAAMSAMAEPIEYVKW